MKMSEESKTEDKVPAILRDPALLFRIKTEFLDHDIVGEDQTKILLFIISASSYTPFPLGAIITGESSSGKSWISKEVLKYFTNVDYYSRMTSHSLDRSEFEFYNKILFIGELYGIRDEEAQSKVRVQISEGKLRLLTTNVEGGGVTTLETQGIPSFITTATQVKTDEELLNRLFILSIDETSEQTQRILEFEADEFENFETLDEEDKREKGEGLRAIWEFVEGTKQAVSGYKIPFASALAKIFPKIKHYHVKARRDFKKLLWIIGTIAYLHQYQRPIIRRLSKKDASIIKTPRWVLALPVDFYMAWRICGKSMQETLMNIQRRELLCLELFEEGEEYDVATIASMIGKSDSRTREFLNDLWQKGYLRRRDHTPDGKLMRPYKYKLISRKVGFGISDFNFASIFRDWDETKLKSFLTSKMCDAVPSECSGKIFTDEVVDPITGKLMNHKEIFEELQKQIEKQSKRPDTASHKTLVSKETKLKPKTMKFGDSTLQTETEQEIKHKTMQETIEYMRGHLRGKPLFTFEEAMKVCKQSGQRKLYCAPLWASLIRDGEINKISEKSLDGKDQFQWVR